jgi:hypothetical protein
MKQKSRVFVAVLAALAASACSHLPDMASISGDTATTPAASPRDRVRAAVELLGQGDERRARTELRAVLEVQPNNAIALRLMQQIEEDPQTLLAGTARAYTVRNGESMSQIAERFLGDGLLFYALARYNGIEAPDQLAAGQTLMIPRRPGAAASERAVLEIAPVEPPAANASPRANQLRLQGLQHLNSGRVDSAVALLRQAQALDGDNPAIQRDLDRAVRLQASLRARAG